jgi:hypothetical protein
LKEINPPSLKLYKMKRFKLNGRIYVSYTDNKLYPLSTNGLDEKAFQADKDWAAKLILIRGEYLIYGAEEF